MINIWAFGWRGFRFGDVLWVEKLCLPGYLSAFLRILLKTNELEICYEKKFDASIDDI
jgi:hypothetical protein